MINSPDVVAADEDPIRTTPVFSRPPLCEENHDKATRPSGSTTTTTTSPTTTATSCQVNRVKGISFMILVSIGGTIHGAIVKHINYLTVGEVMYISSVFYLCFLSMTVSYFDAPLIRFSKKILVFIRLFIGTVALFGKVWSLQNLPLGDATALFFTSPLFTAIIARVFLKEKLNPVHIGAMLAGLAGVILIAKPNFIFKTNSETAPWYNFLVPVLSAACLSTFYVIQRNIGRSVSAYTIAWYSGIFQIVGGVLYHVTSREEYTLPTCFLPRTLLIIAGLCVAHNICLKNLALSYEKATTANLIHNLDTALAFIVQVVLFGVPAETLSLGGAGLIMLGTVCLTFSKIFGFNCGTEF